MVDTLTQSIKTTEKKYPQIYAYTLPNLSEKKGWIKVGETTKKDVKDRILEQVKTPAIDYSKDYLLCWYEPAFRKNGEEFHDKDLHSFYVKNKIEREIDSNNRPTEWFYFNDNPQKAHDLYLDFIKGDYSKLQDGETIPYFLRSEQDEAVQLTLIAQNQGKKEFLWNAKPRFGKTLTTYDLVKRMGAQNVLVVTNRPAIANSWFDDFEKFIGKPYYFVSESPSLNERNPLSRQEFIDQLNSEKNSRQINFVSLQDLKGSKYFGGEYDKLYELKQVEWDLLVIDEAHEGIDTFKTDVAFDNIERKFTLHLSGTPFRALAKEKFTDDQIFNWSYSDEQKSKETWIEYNSEENNPYENLPKLSMFTYKLSDMIIEEVNKGAQIDEDHNIDYMFDLNEFFSTKNNGSFTHEEDVIKFLDSLVTHNKFPFSTPELRNELKHTFWILNRVDSAKALKKLLDQHPVFENYEILLAVGHDYNQAELNDVRKAIKDNDKTITLSVGQLTTGVTIPQWTAVMMLSNMKSPSLYMQSAFRAQNPWTYEDSEGQTYTKKNSYVFDFAPERTLIIFDKFANNLGQNPSNDEEHEANIKKLLNFFPVIGEDEEGKMIELDASKVLTIPKTIKAKEVVKSGFMNNFLFTNIGGIFQSPRAKEILDKLKPEKNGRGESAKNELSISDKVKGNIDKEGNTKIPKEKVVNTTEAVFGPGVYQIEPFETLIDNVTTSTKNVDSISKTIADSIIDSIDFEAFEKEYDLNETQTEKVKKETKEKVKSAVTKESKQFEITKSQIDKEAKNKEHIAETKEEIEKIRLNHNNNVIEAQEEFKKSLEKTIHDTVEDSKLDAVEKLEVKKINNEKKPTEDDVRARLRGFARTIPSFLMAYGEQTTKLANFDIKIKDEVFKEVTGITLEEFRDLRDKYNFFDPVVFDESVQEFLKKRTKLANYFDESQKEDIFDYIPSQETNQIFTPKKVVKMMVDKLQEESPEDFTNPTKTFADLYVKSGLYLTEIIKRLNVGLKDKIPDENERLKHILENQVYGFAPSEIIYNIVLNFIFGFDEKAKNIDKSHIVCLDTVPFASNEADFEAKCDELFGGNK
ncbi:MAG: DEAD/DEAH box helicase family protein [Methanobrevibacter sp.]|jgi:superfamily II DNA or RNA helicase|nr:DEAD/DEAH box helicase family protein [Candidatus Methanoflexus mossambicus]